MPCATCGQEKLQNVMKHVDWCGRCGSISIQLPGNTSVYAPDIVAHCRDFDRDVAKATNASHSMILALWVQSHAPEALGEVGPT